MSQAAHEHHECIPVFGIRHGGRSCSVCDPFFDCMLPWMAGFDDDIAWLVVTTIPPARFVVPKRKFEPGLAARGLPEKWDWVG